MVSAGSFCRDEMVSVKVDGASESEQDKIRLLGSVMQNWHISGP